MKKPKKQKRCFLQIISMPDGAPSKRKEAADTKRERSSVNSLFVLGLWVGAAMTSALALNQYPLFFKICAQGLGPEASQSTRYM